MALFSKKKVDIDEDSGFSFSDVDGNPVDSLQEEKKEHRPLREIELPTGLQGRYVKNYVFAGIVAIITIVLFVMFRTVQCCIGLVIAGYMVFKAIELKYDYADGKIIEITAICASAKYNSFRQVARITFRKEGLDEDDIQYFSFNVPERISFLKQFSTSSSAVSDFDINHVYVIYFKESDPSNLLGYVEL